MTQLGPLSVVTGRARLAVLVLLFLTGCGRGGWPNGAGLVPGKSGQLPASPLVVGATGRESQWRFDFPGADGQLGSADDLRSTGELHLPADAHVQLRLKSEDEAYVFGISGLDLKQIAVPDLDFAMDFRTGRPGTFELQGDPMCGASHPDLGGSLVVEPAPEFLAWLDALDPAASPQARDD